jgi:L-ascorbate metabolism protein UlaG (beta-lactamase superfamily)
MTGRDFAVQACNASEKSQRLSLAHWGGVLPDRDARRWTMLLRSCVVVLCLSLPNAVVAGEGKEVIIRWHGHSFFEIQTSRGTKVAIDPHAIEGYGNANVSADLVLISHEHDDHNQTAVIRNESKARIIRGLKTTGRRSDWNPVDETFRDVHVRSVGVFHDMSDGAERGKNTIFIIEVDGVRIVHLGDLGHLLSDKEIKKIGPVDVLMIPVGGVYTINGAEAKKVVEQLKPRQYILPMHYGTRVFDDLLPAGEFLEDRNNVRRLPGNKLSTTSDFNPSQPETVMLNWR